MGVCCIDNLLKPNHDRNTMVTGAQGAEVGFGSHSYTRGDER